MESEYCIVIPLHNEEASIGLTLDELFSQLPARTTIAVGLNACSDATADVCRKFDVIIGETEELGYGHGCLAAIRAANAAGIRPEAYVFFAGDGANDPKDIARLISRFEANGHPPFVMGLRHFRLGNWLSEFGRALPNLILGVVCRLLGGKFFHDLGPLRLIEAEAFDALNLQELTWGWTIEAQLKAAYLGIPIATIPVEERPRLAGDQKVSGVSLRRSLKIGCWIAAAGVRTWRTRKTPHAEREASSLVEEG